MRRDLERLIELLAPLGVDLTLTTNGSLLPAKAEALAKAGLRPDHRQPRLARRCDVPGAERRRLPGEPGARGHRRRRGRRAAGEGELRGQARRQRRRARWRSPSTSGAPATRCASSSTWTSGTRTAGASTTSCPPPRSSAAIGAAFGIEPIDPAYPGEVARRYRYLDGSGEFGVISSVTQPFCGACTRARLSAEGKLYTCLFAVRGHDLRALDPRRGVGRGARGCRANPVGKPFRPLFGAQIGRHGRPAEGRDELHRRLGKAPEKPRRGRRPPPTCLE